MSWFLGKEKRATPPEARVMEDLKESAPQPGRVVDGTLLGEILEQPAPRQSPTYTLMRALEKRVNAIVPKVGELLKEHRAEIDEAMLRLGDRIQSNTEEERIDALFESVEGQRRRNSDLIDLWAKKLADMQTQVNERFHARDGMVLTMDQSLKRIETIMQEFILEMGYVANYEPERLVPEKIIPAERLPAKVTLRKVKESRKR